MPLITCLAVGFLAAEDGPATGDPFAVYHQAVERQLSAMLENQQAQLLDARATTPVEQRTTPRESKDAEFKVLAKDLWEGREVEFGAALARLQRLRPALESVLSAENVPKQLIAVVLIESGAKPLATSPRQARGLWQLIPETARRYGLIVSTDEDERIRLEAATRAAARYLRDLYGHFGDWPLALAAYNAGEKAVQDALAKGRVTTFWQLRSAGLLPLETRRYVPAVLSAMQLLGSAQPTAVAQSTQHENWVYASASVVY